MSCRLSRSAAAALFSAALLAPIAGARAQFTTVVAPPPRPTVRAESTTAGAGSTARDTVALTRLTNMKQWVDSATVALASGGPAAPAPQADSVAQATAREPGGAASAAGRRHGVVRDSAAGTLAMRDGARAPDTATPLPTVALVGAALVSAGLLLRRRRPRPYTVARKRRGA